MTLAQALEERCLVMAGEGKRLEVTAGGRQWLSQVLGIETARLVPGRHGIARRCLDWTNDGIISPAPWVPLCLIGSANWAGSRKQRTALGRSSCHGEARSH